MTTNARSDDGTDKGARQQLGKGFTFDSEVILGPAVRFGRLHEPLTRALQSIDRNATEVMDELKKPDPALAYVSGPPPGPPVDYPQLVGKLRTAVDRLSTATDHTSQSLNAAGQRYYAQDRSAYLHWKQEGHDLEDLKDNEDLLELKYEPGGGS